MSEEQPQKESNAETLTTEQLKQRQQEIAAIYTGDSVGHIFAMMFNILHSRYPACSPLSKAERDSLGEAWFPIFNEYLSGEGSKWIMPAIITAPIVLVRVSEMQRARKEQEIADTYGMPESPKKEDSKNKKKWSDNL